MFEFSVQKVTCLNLVYKSYMFEFSVQKVTCLNLVYKVENPSNSKEGEGGAFKSNS